MKAYLAEAIGTFALVFCGTSAIVVNDLSGGSVSHLGVSSTFGLIVLAMIYAFGDVSGAHFNPAVTLGFLTAKRMRASVAISYIFAQLIGALVASGTVSFLFPEHQTLGVTMPTGSTGQSFVLETILSFLLMMVILSVATGAKERGLLAGIAIGATVGLEAVFAGPISGASMNPVRSLAPALISGQTMHLWLYLLAPVLGAMLAVFAGAAIFSETNA